MCLRSSPPDNRSLLLICSTITVYSLVCLLGWQGMGSGGVTNRFWLWTQVSKAKKLNTGSFAKFSLCEWSAFMSDNWRKWLTAYLVSSSWLIIIWVKALIRNVRPQTYSEDSSGLAIWAFKAASNRVWIPDRCFPFWQRALVAKFRANLIAIL